MLPLPILAVTIAALAAGGPPVQEVSFPTDDGGEVFADVYGSGERGLVLAHGGRFDKKSWAEQAPVFADAGFRVVAIDFRGRGKSHGGPDARGTEDVHLDVLAAVRYLRRTGAKSVSVVGASFGGWAAARAGMAAPGEIDRLVLMAASGVDEPERLTGRKLFITTRGDSRGEGVLRLPDIRSQYERARDPKELVILDGDAHAQFVFESDQGPRMMDEILEFLTRP